jgi:predicted dehydrogenase
LIRVGLIGCGRFGREHAEAYATVPGVEIAACADVNQQAAQALAREFKVKTICNDADDLLARDDLDAVSIVVPHGFHHVLLMKALGKNKNVWMEKPAGISLDELDRALDAARTSKGLVAIGLIHRYSPAYQLLRELIRRELIGRLRSIRVIVGMNKYMDARWRDPANTPGGWFLDRNLAGGGILLSSTIHFLSLVLSLLGEKPVLRVSAAIRQVHPRAHPGIEDDVDLRLEGSEGVLIEVIDSWGHELGYCFDVVGTQGRLGLKGDLLRPDLGGEFDSPPAGLEFPLNSGRLYVRYEQIANRTGAGPMQLARDFVESLRTGRRHPDLPDLQHTRNLMAIIAAAYQSGQSGQKVEISWK